MLWALTYRGESSRRTGNRVNHNDLLMEFGMLTGIMDFEDL
jgi:hypothetical protein